MAITRPNGIAKSCISGIQKCMESTDHDWSLYRSFLAVVRMGSLSGAARELRTTQPTVGRHIAALESSLGGKSLFTRSQTGLLPTDVARELLPHAEAMASAADALLRAASARSHEVAGTVRISASDVIGAEVLPSILVDFRRLHPRIEIELGLTNQTVDLLRRDADIAVRMLKPEQKALVARKAGTLSLVFHATREYLEKFGMPKNLDELQRHTLIGYDKNLPPQRILDNLPLKVTREMFAFRCDNDLAQIAALRAGLGIAACQYGIARRDPALVPILADQLRVQLELWVVMHENLKKEQKVKLMFDHLVERLAKYVEETEPS